MYEFNLKKFYESRIKHQIDCVKEWYNPKKAKVSDENQKIASDLISDGSTAESYDEKMLIKDQDSVDDNLADKNESEEVEKSDEYDEEGYALIEINDILSDKYFILKKLGWGVSSTIWLAWDLNCNRPYALKVHKGIGMSEPVEEEIAILKTVL